MCGFTDVSALARDYDVATHSREFAMNYGFSAFKIGGNFRQAAGRAGSGAPRPAARVATAE